VLGVIASLDGVAPIRRNSFRVQRSVNMRV
jgi:hypothetical protein